MVVLFTLLKYCILLPNGGLLEVNVAMKYIIYNKFPYIGFLSKSRLSAIDKYVHQCGFINHIDRITEACKQRNKSVYMLFLFRTFYKVYLSVMQQIPFTLGLRVKGDKRAGSLPFLDRKGVRNMKPSSFQTTIENQFDYICKRAMEDERKNYMLYLSRIAKREVSFSDVGDYLVSQFATTDNYSTDFQILHSMGYQ